MNFTSAEWIALAAVVVALIGNIASVLITWMNARAQRTALLYKERIDRLSTVHAAVIRCVFHAGGLDSFADETQREQFLSRGRKLAEAYTAFNESFYSSTIFIPAKIETTIASFSKDMARVVLKVVAIKAKLEQRVPLRDGELEGFEEDIRNVSKQAETIKKSLRELIHK